MNTQSQATRVNAAPFISIRGASILRAWREDDFWLVVLAGAVNVLGCAIKLTVGAHAPFWFDETFTGAFAAEPNLGAVVYQILHDQNAPAYYLIAHFTSLGFGLSDAALRFPALVFGLCAPFLCLLPTRSLSRRTRFVWFALASLWTPALLYSQMARGYSLLFCLCIAATVAFIRLLDRPSVFRAALWGSVGGLAILTHYFALFLIGVQGLVYLAARRERALRTWPAALVFVPTFAWLLVHMSCLMQFVDSKNAWYDRLDGFHLAAVGFMFLGGAPIAFGTAALLLAVWRLAPRPGVSGAAGEDRLGNAVAIAVLGTLLALALVLVIATLKPILTSRYLFPFAPGLLLGLALMMERARSGLFRAAPFVLIGFYACAAWNYSQETELQRRPMNYESASDDLMAAHVKHLAYLWDQPNNAIEDRSQLVAAGKFFFARRGVDIDVRPVQLRPGEDPNRSLIEAAGDKDAAILWLYDLSIHDTAALTFPARIPELDPSWGCRNYGEGRIGVVACVKKSGG